VDKLGTVQAKPQVMVVVDHVEKFHHITLLVCRAVMRVTVKSWNS
jgi:hypothetical protein